MLLVVLESTCLVDELQFAALNIFQYQVKLPDAVYPTLFCVLRLSKRSVLGGGDQTLRHLDSCVHKRQKKNLYLGLFLLSTP